jgi:hypothetical protein
MTPPHVLAETVKQVEKILKSPGCRFVTFHVSSDSEHAFQVISRKTPVFIKSLETAVEIAVCFGKER